MLMRFIILWLFADYYFDLESYSVAISRQALPLP